LHLRPSPAWLPRRTDSRLDVPLPRMPAQNRKCLRGSSMVPEWASQLGARGGEAIRPWGQ